MIIKSVIRGGYRSAAEYMKEQGKNEKTRLVEISDASAKNLDDAFHNMWIVASPTKCTKPLHHISINPAIGERLTDAQLMKIVEHAEEIYGYKMFHHQRVIVEHIKDGRQHFHVIWNRVSLMTGRPVWPGKHWNKSKQICREMEKALGLKSPIPRKGNNRKKYPHGGTRVGNKVKTRNQVFPATLNDSKLNKADHIHRHIPALVFFQCSKGLAIIVGNVKRSRTLVAIKLVHRHCNAWCHKE